MDQNRWLDPLQFGNLLHEVFYHFMGDLMRKGFAPNLHVTGLGCSRSFPNMVPNMPIAIRHRDRVRFAGKC